jgi:transcriptional regulator with XRE-family HTH domain
LEFADLLLQLLRKYHMSQRTLARQSGVSYVTINRLIKGYGSRIGRETVEKIAGGLRCTQEELDSLLRAAGRAPGEIETKFAESPTTARLLRQIASLDNDEALALLKDLEQRHREKAKK